MEENRLPMEPIVLIDKSKSKEVHIVAGTNNSFEDVVRSAQRISTGLFEGDWNLCYIHPDSKQAVPIDKEQTVGELIDKNIDTFYWNYVKPAFKIPTASDYRNTRRHETNTQWQQKSQNQPLNSGKTIFADESAVASAGSGPKVIEYADAGKRISAFIIDWILLFLLLRLFGSNAGGFSVIIWWLYFALMESSTKQATFGKQIMGLKVTDMQGRRISFGKATGRFFAKLLSWMTLLIGFFLAFFTEKKQALHDIITNCLVLEVKEK